MWRGLVVGVMKKAAGLPEEQTGRLCLEVMLEWYYLVKK